MKTKKLFLFLVLITIFSCRQQFTPPAITNYTNYLVVEGLINTGTDSTIIKLSRTVQLNSKTTIKTEAKAKITIESDANASYLLKEIAAGTYAAAALGLNNKSKYRLRIVTADGKIYLSDFVGAKASPPIDSVGYKVLPEGLQIYANTHDPNNNPGYYRWEYDETWEFHSRYATEYIVINDKIVTRPPEKEITFCWTNDHSSDIVLNSTEKLTSNVIYQSVITTIPPTSEKVSLGYSILLKQYALTPEAFTFWQNLKKNTEQLGSIFDAQPSQIQGNIHNVNDAAEPVFGYISAGTVQQKRLTVLSSSWPVSWLLSSQSFNKNCLSAPVMKDAGDKIYRDYYFGSNPTWIPTDPIITPPPAPPDTIGYIGSGVACVDCTLRGSNKRPSFWP